MRVFHSSAARPDRRFVVSGPLLGALTALAACSDAPSGGTPVASPVAPIDDPTAASRAAASPTLESTPPSPVSIDWAPELARHLTVSGDGFRATITNNTRDSLEVDVVTMGMRDDRAAVSVITGLALAPGESGEAFVALDRIPLQASNSALPVKLVAIVHGAGRPAVQIPSVDLAVSFDPSYRLAFASTRDAFGPNVAAARGGDPLDSHVAALLAEPADSILSLAQMRDAMGAAGEDSAHGQVADHLEGRARTGTDGWESLGAGGFVEGRAAESWQGAPRSTTSTLPAAPPTGAYLMFPPYRIRKFTAHVCARYNVGFTDSHLGEDYLADGYWLPIGGRFGRLMWIQAPARARYSAITILDQNGQHITDGYLDSDGCTDLWLAAGGTFTAYVKTKVKRDSTTYDVQYVYPKGIDYTCTTSPLLRRPSLECADNATFTRPFTVTAPNDRSVPVEVTVDSGYDSPSFRVAAVAGQILATPDNGLVANHVYPVFANTGCPGLKQDGQDFSWQEACASADGSYNSIPGWSSYFGIGIGKGHKETTLEKFVIAHEMGHQIQGAQGTMNGNLSYTPDPSAPALCRCDHVTVSNHIHCLQSRHGWDTAETEGWAHFISARTFNQTDSTSCTFGYYKEVLRDNAHVDMPPIAIDCAAPTRWTPNHCAAAGKSSEWDILGFLREVNRGPDGLTMDEIFGVYRRMYSRSWSGFQAATLSYFGNDANNPKVRRVFAAASAYGVDQ